MSFEISCLLRFHVIWICLRLLPNTIEWFRALRPISGRRDGRLSPFDGLLRAPPVLIIRIWKLKVANFCDTKILALLDKDTDDLPCQVFLTRVGHKSNSHTIRLLISLESSVFQM